MQKEPIEFHRMTVQYITSAIIVSICRFKLSFCGISHSILGKGTIIYKYTKQWSTTEIELYRYVLWHYPKYLEASAMEPSTAKIKSSNACIPWNIKEDIIKNLNFASSQQQVKDKSLKETLDHLNKFCIIGFNLWTTFWSSNSRFRGKNLKKLWRRRISIEINRSSYCHAEDWAKAKSCQFDDHLFHIKRTTERAVSFSIFHLLFSWQKVTVNGHSPRNHITGIMELKEQLTSSMYQLKAVRGVPAYWNYPTSQ